jgi:AraC-like DNA-binding protein
MLLAGRCWIRLSSPLGRSARRRSTANRCRAQRARATSRPKAFADPTFEPPVLYGLVGISRSNLYRLFEDSGRVTRYIQRKRLLEVHAVLTDPTTTQSISAISEDLWFAGASSFRRAFKRKFGSSSGDVRLAARAGLTLPLSRTPVLSTGSDFGELLRGS